MKFKLTSCLILFVIVGLALSISMEAFGADDPSGEGAHGHGVDGAKLPIWSIIPFVGILLSIAIFPLVFDSHFLVHHGGKMSLAWGLIFSIPYLIAFRGEAFYDILHIYLIDYIPFIILVVGIVHSRRWNSGAWHVAWHPHR